MDLIEYLETRRIAYQLDENGLQVFGSLDLSNTSITELPDNLLVGRCLFLSNHEKISNIVFRRDCGDEKRTIFAAKMRDGVKIFAGCFQGDLEEFSKAVCEKYSGEDAGIYIGKAKECVDGIKS